MSKSISELLAPRYKVIALYPGCPYEIGCILSVDESGELYSIDHGYTWSVVSIKKENAAMYPHLVKPMEWWEEIIPKDLPEYVKKQKDLTWCFFQKMSATTVKYKQLDIPDDHQIEYLDFVLPSSKEEYTAYINSLNKTEDNG